MANNTGINKCLGNTTLVEIATAMSVARHEQQRIRNAVSTLQRHQLSEATMAELKLKNSEHQKIVASYEVMLEGVYGVTHWEANALCDHLNYL
ncbi:MAG: hypothetical protein FWC16_00545 [Defluviitaleaceae bacterium]|nr:hypothetical protein [Defluviitaleaceae bacterium]MCL2273392.1 hypothetical protein [Defluviitaleaceae bacterium]